MPGEVIRMRQHHAAPAITYDIETHARGRGVLRVTVDDYPGVNITLPLGDTTITVRLSPDEAEHLAKGLTTAAAAVAAARLGAVI